MDGVLGTRTRGGRMEGADESTELWRRLFLLFQLKGESKFSRFPPKKFFNISYKYYTVAVVVATWYSLDMGLQDANLLYHSMTERFAITKLKWQNGHGKSS